MLLSRYIFDKQRFDTLYITEHFRCQLPGNAVDIFQEYVKIKTGKNCLHCESSAIKCDKNKLCFARRTGYFINDYTIKAFD